MKSKLMTEESEHVKLYNKIKALFERHGDKFPMSLKSFASEIVKNHADEEAEKEPKSKDTAETPEMENDETYKMGGKKLKVGFK